MTLVTARQCKQQCKLTSPSGQLHVRRLVTYRRLPAVTGTFRRLPAVTGGYRRIWPPPNKDFKQNG
eukprot:8073781-Heterocapsa_arctica.AAC.1